MYKSIFVGIGIAGIFASGAFLAQPAAAFTIDLQTPLKVFGITKQSISHMVESVSISNKHRICSVLVRNLAHGTQGDDVQGLQEFLHSEGYLSVNPTGYFGPMTREAVAKWQSAQGVSAVGVIGHASRERIRIWCGGDNSQFSASPQYGAAPLSVTFYTKISGFRPIGDTYMIDFGDGLSERAADCYAPTDYCQSPGKNIHTYTSSGTYTATLTHSSDPCAGNPLCMAPVSLEVVGKVRITVGPVACTMEYNPVCGAKPVVCITTPCNPIPTTYSNKCMMRADGASLLYEGVCRPNVCTPRPACLDTMPRCLLPEPVEGWCPIGNKPPVLSGFSGPTILSVYQTGTWTVNANDPENGSLSYRVTWGDEMYPMPMASVSAQESVFVQTTTFTHLYVTPGTYTVTVIVRDSAGNEARTSTTVKVMTTAN